MSILANLKRKWKAVQVSKLILTYKLKNLVCVLTILDLKQNQLFKISKIITANKKFFYSFFNINLSISFNCSSVKKITNQYNINLFKSFGQFLALNNFQKYLCGAVS